MKTFNIDLKWSLWTASREWLAEKAPEVFEYLRDAIDYGYGEEMGGHVIINTAPRKEVRYGTVEFRFGAQTEVSVVFWEPPDEDDPLLMVGLCEPVTVREVFEFDSAETSLDEVLARIDAVEEELIDQIEYLDAMRFNS